MLPQCALGASHLGPPSPGALPGRAGAGRQRPPVLKGAGPWRAARPLPCAEAAARTRQEASAPLACSGDLGSPRTQSPGSCRQELPAQMRGEQVWGPQPTPRPSLPLAPREPLAGVTRRSGFAQPPAELGCSPSFFYLNSTCPGKPVCRPAGGQSPSRPRPLLPPCQGRTATWLETPTPPTPCARDPPLVLCRAASWFPTGPLSHDRAHSTASRT